MTGANPFVLAYDKLAAIAELIRKYFPSVKSIGSFARITDVTPKTDEELAKLQDMGYDGLTIGIETGDDEALRFMNKGYTSADIIEQCQRLDAAGIHYSFFYLVSISGAGRGEIGAKLTADICNQIHPTLIGANMLTIYPDSELYAEIQRGNWKEEGELEKYKEVRTLIEKFADTYHLCGNGSFQCVPVSWAAAKDKKKLLAFLNDIIGNVSEDELQRYRRSVHHL